VGVDPRRSASRILPGVRYTSSVAPSTPPVSRTGAKAAPVEPKAPKAIEPAPFPFRFLAFLFRFYVPPQCWLRKRPFTRSPVSTSRLALDGGWPRLT